MKTLLTPAWSISRVQQTSGTVSFLFSIRIHFIRISWLKFAKLNFKNVFKIYPKLREDLIIVLCWKFVINCNDTMLKLNRVKLIWSLSIYRQTSQKATKAAKYFCNKLRVSFLTFVLTFVCQLFVSGEPNAEGKKKKKIDLQDTDKSRHFSISEFYNCFIIRSPFSFSYVNHSVTAQRSDLPFSHECTWLQLCMSRNITRSKKTPTISNLLPVLLNLTS